ncbi:MAG TPA: PspA/IM30 family protein [Luteimonas sp.]|nr:PspA/IM30 family protein [Luteimonas sp.]
MSLSDLLDRLRERIGEFSEALGGSALMRALDQEIRNTDDSVRESRRTLDTLRAHRFTARERHDAIVAKLAERERQAVAALRARRPALAREVAAAFVDLEGMRDAERQQLADGEQKIAELEHLLERGEHAVRRLKHRLDLVRASESVARAEQAFANPRHGDLAGIPTAIESANRIRARAASPADARDAADARDPGRGHLPLDDLDARLHAAGLTEPGEGTPSPVDAVLARLAPQATARRSATRAPRTPPKARP